MTRQTTAHGQQPLLATVRALYVEAGVGRFYSGVSAYLGLASRLEAGAAARSRPSAVARVAAAARAAAGGGGESASRLGVRAAAAAARCAQI